MATVTEQTNKLLVAGGTALATLLIVLLVLGAWAAGYCH